MPKFKVGDKIKRTRVGVFRAFSQGDVGIIISIENTNNKNKESLTIKSVYREDAYSSGHDPSAWSLVRKPKKVPTSTEHEEVKVVKSKKIKIKKRKRERNLYDFKVPNKHMINHQMILQELSPSNPLAIIRHGDGMASADVHHSVWAKCGMIKNGKKYYEELDEYAFLEFPQKDIGKAVALVKHIRGAKLRKKYRKPLQVQVEIFKL